MSNDLYNNNSIPKSTEFFINDDDDNRCVRFTPNREYFDPPMNVYGENEQTVVTVLDKKLLFVIDLDNSSIYDYFEISFESFMNDNNEVGLRPNQYFITLGRYHVYEFYYKSTKYYSSYLSGFLGLDTVNDDNIGIVIEEKVLAQTPNAFNTALELSYKHRFVVDDNIMTFKNNGN
jgi:hypothetical protein